MKTFFKLFLLASLNLFIAGLLATTIIVLYTNAQLPDVESLEDAQLQVPLRIFTKDGKLIAEYGEKRRTPMTLSEVPEQLKLAILATEDVRFYEHKGVDLRGIARAAVHLITRGTKEQGASTITMQVARNFFLTRKKTFTRKLNEILLALKIEKELSKDKILELYLNKIYFGKRAYGLGAAANVYYGVQPNELTLAQMAMIAGLPQAPSAINPINNPSAAMRRRTHVLNRMLYYHAITQAEFEEANSAPLTATYHGRTVDLEAPYVAELARIQLVEMFGDKVYNSGFEVTTTIHSAHQLAAQKALRQGLLEYDKRHGYRGPLDNLFQLGISETDWPQKLTDFQTLPKLQPAAITNLYDDYAEGILENEQTIMIPFSTMQWARTLYKNDFLGPIPNAPKDVLRIGDVIYVEPQNNLWQLSQLPKVSGAFIALNPNSGAVLALMGGYDFRVSHFNRATQAHRQPGSNFKPFIYSAALENGFTAASIINDAPVVFNDPTLEGIWRPQNDTRQFYGPTRLRVGITKSRNLVSIRLLEALGLKKAIEVLNRFGFPKDSLPQGLSLALGTPTLKPIDVAAGYATFANGGFRVTPHLIDKVEAYDEVLFEANPQIACDACLELLEQRVFSDNLSFFEEETISNIMPAQRILSPQTTYIMTSLLQDAIQTGTGRRAKVLGRSDIAGKTGTTNRKMDAWYSGYNQNIVATAWVGFDEPRTLQEYGSQAALPIWIDFMGTALKNTPELPYEEPPEIVTIKIDPETGLLARPGQTNAIFEVFQEDTAPTHMAPAISLEPQVVITPSGKSNTETLF